MFLPLMLNVTMTKQLLPHLPNVFEELFGAATIFPSIRNEELGIRNFFPDSKIKMPSEKLGGKNFFSS